MEEDELAIEIEKKRTLLNENKKKNADMMVRKHDYKRNKKSTEYKIGVFQSRFHELIALVLLLLGCQE